MEASTGNAGLQTNITVRIPTTNYHNRNNVDSTSIVVHVAPEIERLPGPSSPSPPNYDSTNINITSNIQLANDEDSGGIVREGLPTYEEATNPEAPPPSYDSLFGRVRQARKSSNGIMGFFVNIIIILLGTIGCTVIIGMTIVIPICMVVFGLLYLHECPQSELIPVYLLVGGLFGVVKQLLHLSTRVKSGADQERERLRQSPTQSLINCFMLGWFIIGSYWIYKEYEPNYDPNKGNYCNKALYLFAFWLVTSVYIFLGLVTVGLCSATVAFASLLENNRPST